MRKFNQFLDKYKSLIWVILMVSFCILDIVVLIVDFNIWSLIGLICCAISAVLHAINFVITLRNRDEEV